MQLGKVIPLDEPLAINAAKQGYDLKLTLAIENWKSQNKDSDKLWIFKTVSLFEI
jgi:hypothetical protein